MTDLNRLVARNVQRYRTERGLSLGELARRAGLSKQTLSKLEQGEGNPTVDTLAAVGEALDVPTRRFLTEPAAPVVVQRAKDAPWEPVNGFGLRLLGEAYGAGYARMEVFEFVRGSDELVPPHRAGTLHHAYVLAGRVACGPVGEQVDLGPGDYMRFPGDVPHRHDCLTDKASVIMMTTYPQAGDRQAPSA